MSEELSASGAPIHRHEESRPPSWSGGDPELIEAVDAHVTRHIGKPGHVWHEPASAYVHVDVHVVEPTEERPVYTLVTSGMSERPMEGPRGDTYAELLMLLPPSWPAPGGAEQLQPDVLWPYRLLQDLARLPHEFGTWLWKGHTVPNGDPPEPYARDTALCGALVAPLLLHDDEVERLRAGDRDVHLFGVIPLHADEMQLKLDGGADALWDLLDEARVSEMLDPDRPSVVPRRRRGLFRR